MNKANENAVPETSMSDVDELTVLVSAAVDRWYAENMHNSVVSRDTAVHNHIQGAKPLLVRDLVEALKNPSD